MVAVVCFFAWVSAAHAATITVTTTADTWADDGQCSLREAVASANSDAPQHDCPAGTGTDTVVVPAGTYKLTRLPSLSPGGYLPLVGNMTITGAGQDATIIDGNKTDRVFGTSSGPTITIEKLTVANGLASDPGTFGPGNTFGAPGIKGAEGKDGGGIQNYGTMTLTSVIVRDNAAGAGGNGGTSFGNDATGNSTGGTGVGGAGGPGGNGGGIWNRGSLTIKDSTVTGNAAGNGGAGSYGFGGNSASGYGGAGIGGIGGPGGSGGGIFSDGTLVVANSVVSSNKAGSGGYGGVGQGGKGGSGAQTGGDGGAGNAINLSDASGGPGGAGGGVYATAGTIADTSIAQNTAGNGGHGQDGFGGGGGNGTQQGGRAGSSSGGFGGPGGSGGGVFLAGPVDVARVALLANVAGNGGPGADGRGGTPGAPNGQYSTGYGGSGGPGGSGGGLGESGAGARSLTDLLVDGNTAGSGANGGTYTGSASAGPFYGSGDGGAAGLGGGLDLRVDPTTLARATITANKLGTAGAPGPRPGASVLATVGAAGAAPSGAAVYGAASTRVVGSIFAFNLPPGPYCGGALTDAGNNLDWHGDPICPGPGIVADLGLGPVADNGGISLSRRLLPGSPAIDAYSCTVGTDQRGVARPTGAKCDIGAYEVAAPIVTDVTATPTTTGWTLSAKVTPNGLGSVVFDYGTGVAYGTTTPVQKLSGGLAQVVSAPITGLATLTTYHFRARVTSTDGNATSPDEDFTTTGNAGGGVTPGGLEDKTAPALSKVKVSPSTFAVGKGRTAQNAGTKVASGTTLKFTLSEAASVKLTFERVTTGKKVKSRAKKGKKPKTTCKAAKHPPTKRSARCTLYRAAGFLARKGATGANSVKFTGRIGSKALKPGVYRLTVFAIDGAANRSKTAVAKFTVVKR